MATCTTTEWRVHCRARHYLGDATLPLAPLDDFFFDQGYRCAIGSARPARGNTEPKPGHQPGRPPPWLSIDLPGMPHLGSASPGRGRAQTASDHRAGITQFEDGVISVIDMQTWKTITPESRPLGRAFHAQPRIQPLRLGRRHDEPRPKQAHADRQGHLQPARTIEGRSRQDPGAHRVHPRRQYAPGQPGKWTAP